MKNNKNMNFSIDGEIKEYDILKDDPEIVLLDLRIVNVGLNPNRTFFSKDSITNSVIKRYDELIAKPIPLLLVYDKMRNDASDHTPTAIKDRYMIGLIPANSYIRFQEFNGKEYLYATAIVYKSYFPNFSEIIKNNAENNPDGEFARISMEVLGLEIEEKEDYLDILDFSLKGVMFLSNKVKSGIELAGANILKYDLDKNEIDNVKDYNNLIEKSNEYITNYYSENKSSDNDNKNNSNNSNNDNKEDNKEKITITIDNSKESAKNGSWSNPGSKLYSKLLNATNSKSAINEAYFIAEDGYEDHPSESLKFPHHVLTSDNKLVLHIGGVEAAGSRLNQAKSQNKISDSEYLKAYKHNAKHRKELEMDELEKFNFKFQINKDKLNLDFDINGMTVNNLRNKLNGSISHEKYWVADFYVDENMHYVIVEDYDEGKYFAIPYIINENNDVELDMENMCEVENTYVPTGKFSKNNEEMEAQKMAKNVSENEKEKLNSSGDDTMNNSDSPEKDEDFAKKSKSNGEENKTEPENKDDKAEQKGGKKEMSKEFGHENLENFSVEAIDAIMEYRSHIKDLEVDIEKYKKLYESVKDFEGKYTKAEEELKKLRIFQDIKIKEENIAQKESVLAYYTKSYTFTEDHSRKLQSLKDNPNINVKEFRAEISAIVEQYSNTAYSPSLNLSMFSAIHANTGFSNESNPATETSADRLLKNANK